MSITEHTKSKNRSAPSLVVYAEGDVIDDRFTVKECLKFGQIFSIYSCTNTGLDGKPIAIKLLQPASMQNETIVARFEKEVLALYSISHANIVRTYELIKNDDVIGYSMESIEGETIEDVIQSKRKFSVTEALDIGTQVCAGLTAVHAVGIVHRDLKPDNIWLLESGEVKIANFGVARVPGGKQLTALGEVVGSTDFVSPEYISSGEVDHRSDVYAVGLLLYTLISGAPPYPPSANAVNSILVRLKEDPKPLHKIARGCPLDVSDVVHKAMSRDPEARYQSAAELLDALSEFHTKIEEGQISTIPKKSTVEVEAVTPGEDPAWSSFDTVKEITDGGQAPMKTWEIVLSLLILVVGGVSLSVLLAYL